MCCFRSTTSVEYLPIQLHSFGDSVSLLFPQHSLGRVFAVNLSLYLEMKLYEFNVCIQCQWFSCCSSSVVKNIDRMYRMATVCGTVERKKLKLIDVRMTTAVMNGR